MVSITKLYPLLKEMGLDDNGARDFIETLEETSLSRLEKAIEHLATKEDLALMREDMALMKADMIKWNVGTIIAVAGLVTAIVKLIG